MAALEFASAPDPGVHQPLMPTLVGDQHQVVASFEFRGNDQLAAIDVVAFQRRKLQAGQWRGSSLPRGRSLIAERRAEQHGNEEGNR